jgi:LysR family hydrogen peroxide-inducible transcriptional activator
MIALPSLRQLEYLVALDTHGHFAEAARACGVGTPAFSSGLAAMEALLGIRVADRDRRRVAMTPIGRRLAAQARRVLAEAMAFSALAAGESPPMAGTWRLGSIPTIAPFLMPRLLPAMRQRFPDLDLALSEGKTIDLLAQLEDGRLDLLLIAFPYEVPSCDAEFLFADSYLFACSPRCELAGTPRIGPEAIASQPLMLLEASNCLHHHALPVLETAAKAPQATFAGTSLHTLAAMVAVDMGSTLLPTLAVEGGLLRGTDVVVRPLGYEAGRRTLGLCWRRGHVRANEFRQLGGAIREWAVALGIGEPLAKPEGRPSKRPARWAGERG